MPVIQTLMTTVTDVIEQRSPRESIAVLIIWADLIAIPLITLVLPLLSLQYGRQTGNPELQLTTISIILNLATINPLAFKNVLQQMEAGERKRLESALRFTLAGRHEERTEERTQPSISLKLDFASVE